MAQNLLLKIFLWIYRSPISILKKSLSGFDLASVEKLHIQKVLIHTKGNKTEAARLLNIGLTTLYRKIEEYSLIIIGFEHFHFDK